MLHEKTISHIRNLRDADLVGYVLTGTRAYEPEAIAFAQAELDNRHLPPEQLAAIRTPIIAKLAAYDAQAAPNASRRGPHSPAAILCQGCGVEAPTVYAEYHQNIGAMVIRFSKCYKGHLCKNCNSKYFWQASGITAFAGWWGVISFFVTPVFLLMNVVAYLGTSSLPPVPREACRPRLDDDTLAKISPYVPAITERLNAGDNAIAIARDIAPAAGVTPGQIWFFIIQVLHQPPASKATVAPPMRR